MRAFLAKIFLTALTVLAVFSAYGAEKITFETHAPLTVAVGEAFRVEFSLNAKPDESTFSAPSFEGFDVLAGPAVSKGQRISIVNGSMDKTVEYKITYVLLPQAEGNVTIGSASIAVDGTTYSTDPVPVEIVREAGSGSSAQHGGSGGQSAAPDSGQTAAQGQLAKDDVLLRAEVSRTSVYKGEPLRVSFKLYTRVPIVGSQGESWPSFNGFWAQELDVNSVPRAGRETLGGKVYNAQVVREYLLYPQQAGKLVIEPAELTLLAQVVVQNSRNMDPFFGGGPDIYNVPRKVATQRVTVNVKELPAGAPESFSGAVGNYTMEATLPETHLAANSAATYTVKISGTGNLTFVQAPKLTLPGSFEQYNVKTTESMKTTAAGTTGYRQFEYPFIARAEGEYEIAPVEFTYFDPAKKQYITLSTARLPINVAPDAGGGAAAQVVTGLSKEDVKLLGQDIRFIKLGRGNLHLQGRPFMGGTLYFVLLAAIVGLFAAAYVALRKRIRDRQNAVLMRGKRANKVAVQRFRAAAKFMQEENRHAFYEEMLRALWGYMSDKFNIPVANLTKENVREELNKRGVSQELSQSFSEIISQCDEAQYSPLAGARMSDVYNAGVDFISKLESVIKK